MVMAERSRARVRLWPRCRIAVIVLAICSLTASLGLGLHCAVFRTSGPSAVKSSPRLAVREQMARTITAIRHRGHNLTRARERSAITISNPCTDQMLAHYTRSPQAHTSRKLPLRIYFDARRPTWGCIFEFRTRRKPFRVKTNRSNGGGSHNGGTYNDSKNGAGLEANIPIVSPGLASTVTLALRGPASPAVRVQCQFTKNSALVSFPGLTRSTGPRRLFESHASCLDVSLSVLCAMLWCRVLRQRLYISSESLRPV